MCCLLVDVVLTGSHSWPSCNRANSACRPGSVTSRTTAAHIRLWHTHIHAHAQPKGTKHLPGIWLFSGQSPNLNCSTSVRLVLLSCKHKHCNFSFVDSHQGYLHLRAAIVPQTHPVSSYSDWRLCFSFETGFLRNLKRVWEKQAHKNLFYFKP